MEYALRLDRELFVPRELVFEVWTEARHLSGWYAPGGGLGRTAQVDLRPGGAFRLTWSGPDGTLFEEHGTYREVDPPAGFRCSLCFGGAHAEHFCTELAVSFEPLGGSTRIEIHQSGYPTAALRDAHRRAWPDFLDQLEAYFAVI